MDKEGAGDGDLAVEMKLKLKDLRDPAAIQEMTDEEMYKIISKGKGQMARRGRAVGRARDLERAELCKVAGESQDVDFPLAEQLYPASTYR